VTASSHLDGAGLGFTIRPALTSDIAAMSDIDDDATALYAEHGLSISLGEEHVFVRAELARWLRSTELKRAFVAIDRADRALGFAALDVVDDEPYLDQLAVRVAAMRRGIGRRLLAQAVDWGRAAGGSALWLTTYDHVPFNRAYYERHGYLVVPERACGPGLLHHLEQQRRYLPEPAQRVAMRRLL
jgi:GNAT superfamily N-acetyltransferase